MRWIHGFVAVAAIGSATACTSFSERHIVGVVERTEGNNQLVPSQFYRISLSGYSYLQRTEFQSGWYDADAVDTLFSEVTKKVSDLNDPSKPKPTPALDPGEAVSGAAPPPPSADGERPSRSAAIAATKGKKTKRHHVVYGPRGSYTSVDGKRFVVFAANNPKEIVNQIDALTTSAETASLLGHVLRSDDKEELARTNESVAADLNDRKVLLARIEAEIGRLSELKGKASLDASERAPSKYWALVADLLSALPRAR